VEFFGLTFSGGIRFGDLKSRAAEIPQLPGVYAIASTSLVSPNFLETGTGGHFKGVDPNVSVAELRANWVSQASVLYIGKAGGHEIKATVRSRLRQYEAFGRGVAVGHKGGRYIWQLSDSKELLVWWHIDEMEPSFLENRLISDFKRTYGARPFANLKG
jgi:hypothetical protein